MRHKFTISSIAILIIFQISITAQSGLKAFYPFNGNTNDVSGNNYNGTNIGATLTTDRLGNPNAAYSFNGINNYISIPTNVFDYPEFTYAAWVNMNNLTDFAQTVISIGNIGADQVINVYNQNNVIGNQYFTFFSYTGYASSNLPNIMVPTTNTLNKWQFLVGTRSLTELKFYVDGALVGSIATTLPPAYSTPIQATIGARSRNDIQFFSGKIDDVSIYNRVISAQEVSNLYNYNTLEAPAAAGSASFILQVNDAESDFVFNANGAPTAELARLKGTGKLGLATPDPKSTLDINGTFGTKIKKITVNGTTTLDETATVWYFTNIGSITLPSAASCPNRRYSIVNRRPEARVFTNNFIDLNGGNNTYILANSGIELISDGTNWVQLK